MVAIEHLFGCVFRQSAGAGWMQCADKRVQLSKHHTFTPGYHVNVITQTHRRLDLRPCSSPRLEDVRRFAAIVDVAAGPGVADTRDQGAAGEGDLYAALRYRTLETSFGWLKNMQLCSSEECMCLA